MKEENNTSAEYQSELLKCEICGKQMKSITNSHLRDKHNMTTEEYRIIYPNSKMIRDGHNSKLSEWRNSERNKAHCVEMNKITANCEKRKQKCREVTQSLEYRQNHSRRMKEYVKRHPESIVWKSIRGKNHHHYGKSNWQRWFDKYGEEVANQKLAEWKQKNRIPSTSRDTKIERNVRSILEKHQIEYIHQYDKISSIYIDFFIPKANLALEIHGDYWHANPKKYKPDEEIKYPGNRTIKASEIWDKDRKRVEKIKSLGYSVIELFESDITEDTVINSINRLIKI
jgi:G:T-mismatch repair DNA endonuclease (very short patch repair protein)